MTARFEILGDPCVGFSFSDLKKAGKAVLMPQEGAKLIASKVVPAKYRDKVNTALDPGAALKAAAISRLPPKYQGIAKALSSPTLNPGGAMKKALIDRLPAKYQGLANALTDPTGQKLIAMIKKPAGSPGSLPSSPGGASSFAPSEPEPDQSEQSTADAAMDQFPPSEDEPSEASEPLEDEPAGEVLGRFKLDLKGISGLVKAVGPAVATIYPPAAPLVAGATAILNKAQAGDPAAAASIAATQAAAASGDPKAAEAVALLKAAGALKSNVAATALLKSAASGDPDAVARLASLREAGGPGLDAVNSAMRGAAMMIERGYN